LQVLGDDCRALLRVAAVQGREFRSELLAVAGYEGQRSLILLAEAVRLGVARACPEELGKYAFSHVLIRDALYEEIPADLRAALHATIGAALEARLTAATGQRLTELSHHFLKAVPACDDGRALKYTLLAGEHATKHLAFEDAANHFRNADRLLELRDGNPLERLDVLLRRGEALRLARDIPGSREALLRAAEFARALRSAEGMARVAIELGRPLESGRADPERVNLLRDALSALPDSDARHPLLGALLARALLFAGGVAERTELAREALERAKRSDDVEIAAETLQVCHEALLEPQHLEERYAIGNELFRLGRRLGDSEWLLHGCVAQAMDHMALGDFRAVDDAIQTTETLAAQVRQPLFRWYARAFRATRALVAGEFGAAERLARDALRFGPCVGEEGAYHSYCCQVTAAWIWQGRLVEAEPVLREISLRYPALAGWRAVLATVQGQLGQRSRAREELEELVERDLSQIRSEPFALAALAPAANLCVFVGDAKRALPLYDAMLPYERQHGIVSYGMSSYGPIARHLGALAMLMRDKDAARRHFERSLDMAERMPSPPFVALTSYQLGALLDESKDSADRERAGSLLSRAAAISESLGLRWLRKAADHARAARA